MFEGVSENSRRMGVRDPRYPRKKKSDFSADFSAKNRFSGGMETILTKKKSEEKNR